MSGIDIWRGSGGASNNLRKLVTDCLEFGHVAFQYASVFTYIYIDTYIWRGSGGALNFVSSNPYISLGS
jgi:hypothetical protein